MVFLVSAGLIAFAILVFTLWLRDSDVPQTPPPPPWQYLETRKATIYDNLRDLQFEYRVGKLSDEDYQRTKVELQKQLAGVLAEIDRLQGTASGSPARPAAGGGKKAAGGPPAEPAKSPVAEDAGMVPPATAEEEEPNKQHTCPHCGSSFAEALKFCGECGKPMSGASA